MRIKTYLDHELCVQDGDFNFFEVNDAKTLITIMSYFKNKVVIINQEDGLWLVELELISGA